MDTGFELAAAQAGNPAAQDALIRATQDLVYNLAVRMLGSPVDAEDATQDILLKIVTQLASFRGDSSFRTWAYRVAANHLLTVKKRAAETRVTGFDALGAGLDANLVNTDPPVTDQILLHEAKLICTSSMLVCLDREHRLAFVLGDILELPGDEAAAIADVEPAAFRKRLQRARSALSAFMANRCGLADEAYPCRCGKQAAMAVRAGLVDPACLVWAKRETNGPAAHVEARAQREARVDDIAGLVSAVAIFRGHPTYAAPGELVRRVRAAIDAGTSDLLR